LGWYATLLGFFHESMVQFQHRYYKSEHSRKTGLSCAKKVTLKLWNIIYEVWIRRNSVLHDTDAIHQVSGIAKLHQAISLEHTRGLGHLHRVYNRYYAIPLATLLSKPLPRKNGSLLFVRLEKPQIISSMTTLPRILLSALGWPTAPSRHLIIY